MTIDYQHFRTDKWGAAGILLRFLQYMVFVAAPIPAAPKIGLSLSWNTGLPVFAIAWRQIRFITRWTRLNSTARWWRSGGPTDFETEICGNQPLEKLRRFYFVWQAIQIV
jgi:hypothetical protein